MQIFSFLLFFIIISCRSGFPSHTTSLWHQAFLQCLLMMKSVSVGLYESVFTSRSFLKNIFIVHKHEIGWSSSLLAFFFIFPFSYVWVFCLCLSLCIRYLQYLLRLEESIGFPEAGVTDPDKTPSGYWELNPGLLEEQSVLTAGEWCTPPGPFLTTQTCRSSPVSYFPPSNCIFMFLFLTA